MERSLEAALKLGSAVIARITTACVDHFSFAANWTRIADFIADIYVRGPYVLNRVNKDYFRTLGRGSWRC